MNLSRLDRDELEAILLNPPAALGLPLRCAEPPVIAGLPPARDRRAIRVRYALAAAHELLVRIENQNLIGRETLSAPSLVKSFLALKFAAAEHETFVVIFLDAQSRVIGTEEMFRGTVTQTSVYPREVVKEALARNAAAVILAHNHPSGEAEPSRADEHLTQTLKSALSLVDVNVLDHLVVAGNTSISFAERGLL